MKRTLIPDKIALPERYCEYYRDADVYDSSCSREARVYFIDKGPGFFLKIGKRGALKREAEMDKYFHSLGLGAAVVDYFSDENDLLLTRRVPGEDLTCPEYLSDGKWLATEMGKILRALHSLSGDGCPVKNKTKEYVSTAENNYLTGNYDKDAFNPDSFGYRDPEEAYRVFSEGKNDLSCDTLLHGDFCLPNIMMKDGRLTGFIDLGGGGIGDRHIDLFWGAWTLYYNLKTDRYTDLFLDSYGKDGVDRYLLHTVAAAEVFL